MLARNKTIRLPLFNGAKMRIAVMGILLLLISLLMVGGCTREVVKEVPVEKVVEKQVVKEVPVEKVVEKQVVKEVPKTLAPIKIGILETTSGAYGWIGQAMLDGILIATSEQNAKGGINGHPIDYVVGDDAANPQKTMSLLVKYLEEEKVSALLGPPMSAPAAAVVEQMQKTGKYVPAIGTGGSLQLLHGDYASREWYFSSGMDVYYAAPDAVDFHVKKFGAKKIGALYVKSPAAIDYTTKAREKAAALGIQWVEEGIDLAQTDVSLNVKRLKDAGVDTVMNNLMPIPAQVLGWLRAKQQLNWNVPWTVSEVTIGGHIESVPELVEGAYIQVQFDPKTPLFKHLLAAYTSRFGRDLVHYDSTGMGYVAAKALFDAMSKAKDPYNSKEVRDLLETGTKIDRLSGVSGQVEFSKDNHSLVTTTFYAKVIGGKKVYE